MSNKVLTYSGIPEASILVVQNFAAQRGYPLLSVYDDSVTHVIVPNDFPNYNSCYNNSEYILGIAHKKFIVSCQWVNDSQHLEQDSPEQNYVVQDPCTKISSSEKAGSALSPIFDKFAFFCKTLPNFPTFEDRVEMSASDLQGIITTNGGKLVSNLEELKCSDRHKIYLYPHDFFEKLDPNLENNGIVTIDIKWVLNSIRHYELQPLHLYVLSSSEDLSYSNIPHDILQVARSKEAFNRIRQRLQGIFVNVDKKFIEASCLRYMRKQCIFHEDHIVNLILDYLLIEGPHHEILPNDDNADISIADANAKVEYLTGLFPDADPTYLQSTVDNDLSEDDFQKFIEEHLENPTYPTKKQYIERKRREELRSKYLDNFDVSSFLKIFPDPVEYFESKSRVCRNENSKIEFLEAHFSGHQVETISRLYSENSFNVTLTAIELFKTEKDLIGSPRELAFNIPVDNIPLLQEIAYVTHHHVIKEHIEKSKEVREKLLKKLEEENKLLLCNTCYSDKIIPDESHECTKGDTFCTPCLKQGIDIYLSEKQSKIACFKCKNGEFSIETLKTVLSPPKFDALIKMIQASEMEASGIEGLEVCPFCSFSLILTKEDKIFKCQAPDCMKETCRLCKKFSHVPYKCNELEKREKARLLIEEKMAEALIRRCYNCNKQFMKDDIGQCNLMVCSCSAKMCYLCDARDVNYSHFNAQGAEKNDLCALYTDDGRLDAESARAVGHTVTRKIMEIDPLLQLDVDLILPALPEKIGGSHETVSNAYMLPARIQKLTAADFLKRIRLEE